MRLLFVVPYAPDPIRVRPYNLIRSLAKRGHQVTLVTLWSGETERAYLQELGANGIEVLAAPLTRTRSAWNCLRTIIRPTPLQGVYCWQPKLMQTIQCAIRNTQSRYDLVHVEHLRGARYGTHLQFAIRNSQFDIPIVWDSVDCISYLFGQSSRVSRSAFGRLVTRFELPRTRWYEAWLVRQFDRVLVTSEQDRHAFRDLVLEFAPPSSGHVTGMNRISVLPNGVDLDYFAPIGLQRAPQTLVFTGKMSYHANVTAALYLVNETMPLVWEKLPDARVQIVGQNPPREVVKLGQQHPERVLITGTVGDLRPYLAQATLAVAPITYGAGIQNKVLEAMAMATPVVATSQAVAALSVRKEEEVLIGVNPELFSQQVIRLLLNPALRERLGRKGRKYVELNHNWDGITHRLVDIYQEVVAVRKSMV